MLVNLYFGQPLKYDWVSQDDRILIYVGFITETLEAFLLCKYILPEYK